MAMNARRPGQFRRAILDRPILGAFLLAVLCALAVVLGTMLGNRPGPFRIGFFTSEETWEQQENAIGMHEALFQRGARRHGPMRIVDIGHRSGPRWGDYRFDRRRVAADCRQVDLLVCFGSPDSIGLRPAFLPPVIVMARFDVRCEEFAERLRREGHPVTAIIGRISTERYLRLVLGLLPKARRIGLLGFEGDADATATAARLVPAFRERGVETRVATAPPTGSLATVASSLATDCDAVLLLSSPTTLEDRERLRALVRERRLPLFGQSRWTDSTICLAHLDAVYGVDGPDRILAISRGARVEDYPFLTFEADRATLDLDVARKIGLTFTNEVLRAAGVTILQRKQNVDDPYPSQWTLPR